MANQLPGTAPDAGTVLKFVASLVWRSKWLIAAAAIVVAALTFALYKPAATAEAWTGKTILTIGVAPAVEYVLQGSGSALTPIEPPRSLVMRISDPVFKNN